MPGDDIASAAAVNHDLCWLCGRPGGLSSHRGSVTCRYCHSIYPAGVAPVFADPFQNGDVSDHDLEHLRDMREKASRSWGLRRR